MAMAMAAAGRRLRSGVGNEMIPAAATADSITSAGQDARPTCC